MDERPDPERVQQRSDTDVTAEQPTRRHHYKFDAGSNEPDGQSCSRDEPRHQSVTRPGPHSGAYVESCRERIHDDSGNQKRDSER